MEKESDYLRVYEGRDTKIGISFGLLYVCSPRTWNTWLKVQAIEDTPRGKIYLTKQPEVRFKLV